MSIAKEEWDKYAVKGELPGQSVPVSKLIRAKM
jgi:hypothetical protein